MTKKICIITTSEENYFTPSFLQYCSKIRKINMEIVFVPGFLNIKKFCYMFLMLRINEIIEVIYFKLFKSKINYQCKFNEFESVNKNKVCKFINRNKFDLIVSYNCNQIFSEKTLKKIECDIVNFHPGLLPKYKGLFPNFYSLKNREKYIGITFHKINKKIDSGKILKKLKIRIEKKDTIFKLYKKIFFGRKSHKFIYNCILNYKKLSRIKLQSKDLYKYNSYPKLIDVIKFKFNQ